MKQGEVKNPGSKPVKWNESRPSIAYQLALLGATDKQIAEVMDVDVQTIDNWKRTKPEFLAELNRGKLQADTAVVEAFYRCATGYDYTEDVVVSYKGEVQVVTVTKHRPPDPWSCAKWLALRQREQWSEAQKVEITNNTNINIAQIDLTKLTMEELKMAKSIGLKALQPNGGN